MHRRSAFPIIITLAMFVLTWSPDFTVEGVPSRHDQCQQRGYDVACVYDTKINPCEVLTCGRREHAGYTSQRIIVREGIADGMACGPSKICRNKKCVDAGEGMPQCPQENNLVHCLRRRQLRNDLVKTREQQCQDFGFDVACVKPEGIIVRSCRHLDCGYKISDDQYVHGGRKNLPFSLLPITGSWCHVDEACYEKTCIPLSEWPPSLPKPTYTDCESFWPCNATNI